VKTWFQNFGFKFNLRRYALDDCHASPMRKRWLEPRGVFVLFDIVRNFAPVIVIKHWSFTAMWFMTHADDYGGGLYMLNVLFRVQGLGFRVPIAGNHPVSTIAPIKCNKTSFTNFALSNAACTAAYRRRAHGDAVERPGRQRRDA
jgi:hypothetical protein